MFFLGRAGTGRLRVAEATQRLLDFLLLICQINKAEIFLVFGKRMTRRRQQCSGKPAAANYCV